MLDAVDHSRVDVAAADHVDDLERRAALRHTSGELGGFEWHDSIKPERREGAVLAGGALPEHRGLQRRRLRAGRVHPDVIHRHRRVAPRVHRGSTRPRTTSPLNLGICYALGNKGW